MSHTFNWCQDRTKLSIYAVTIAKYWYLDGKRHRVDGPAIECVDGYKWWYLDGKEYSESDYWKELYKCVQHITGVKIKLN